MKPVSIEGPVIKVLGSKEAVSEMSEMGDVVEFSLCTLNGRSGVTIEAFVVNDISTIPNIYVESVERDFSHLNNVWFVDVCRESEILEVVCLVGQTGFGHFKKGK